MRRGFSLLTVLANLFIAVNGLAFEGTGKWNYQEHSASNNCGVIYVYESGSVDVLQTGSTFIIVGDHFSKPGNVSGNIYTYLDKWCEDDGVVTANTAITLNSDTNATGAVNWTWSGDGQSCSGRHELNLSKGAISPHVYDAGGRWNYTQSGFWSGCGSSSSWKSSGYFTVTQTGNRITAVDDEGRNYSGYVNGATYYIVRSYIESGGRTTEVFTITLDSGTTGSGAARFVWDDDCDDCNGGWNISISKDEFTITAGSSAGGVVSPSGTVTVTGGASQVFQISADAGYEIRDVLVDGVSVGVQSSYTFPNVSSNHTLYIEFALKRAGTAVPSVILLMED